LWRIDSAWRSTRTIGPSARSAHRPVAATTPCDAPHASSPPAAASQPTTTITRESRLGCCNAEPFL
jgi:hypothetical protein